MTQKPYKSALKVQGGIAQPASVNKNALQNIRKNKPATLTTAQMVEGILAGNITLLSQAITLIESTLAEHQQRAQEVLKACLPFSGKSVRVGITGVPGVGKSSFIDVLGTYLTKLRKKVAVLAIDPSSYRSKGSILGDKTRMEELSTDCHAFIRPSPSAGTLGGVAQKTWESIILCEAAGFDTIFVETVGVGQSETLVHAMVDFFLLLMLAGAGDELQGIKRGIMEMADALVINKADGNNIARAKLAQTEYQNALHLYPLPDSGWLPVVTTCSAHEKTGIADVWDIVEDYIAFTKRNNYFNIKRTEQDLQLMHHALKDLLLSNFYACDEIKDQIRQVEKDIEKKRISSYNAAKKLSELYYSILNKR
ncbi:MAG: methylmalonyl Co-A mutase-associated GTPase MeaB [Bacteroidota bacterium]